MNWTDLSDVETLREERIILEKGRKNLEAALLDYQEFLSSEECHGVIKQTEYLFKRAVDLGRIFGLENDKMRERHGGRSLLSFTSCVSSCPFIVSFKSSCLHADFLAYSSVRFINATYNYDWLVESSVVTPYLSYCDICMVIY